MNGGTRTKEAGCPGPSWLTTCCSPGGVTRSEREDQRPLAPAIRSNPGGAPFALANSIGESIANFGRDDCKSLIDQFLIFHPVTEPITNFSLCGFLNV